MPELPTDADALEQIFRRNGLPMRHLRPWWVRLYRRLGLNPKPPVLFNLAEHYLWEGLSIVAITTTGYLICWWQFGTPASVLAVFYAMALVFPPVNWIIRRRIRARLSQ